MKKNTTRIILFFLTLITVIMLFFLIKNQIIEVIKLAKENNQEGIKELIKNRGILGILSIIIIEAIQMVVVFIPAEFVQLSAGISYPFYFSLIFCQIGVFLGATIIYLLVNYLKFDKSIFGKSNRKIETIAKQKKANVTTQLLMYLLFVMPIIPFGAICYFGSSSKITYRRYIFTCVTGVIPSILTSIIMGNSIVYFTSQGYPLWLLILVIIGLAAILFLIAAIVIRKYFYDESSRKGPNIFFYSFYYFIFKLFVESKMHVRVNNKEIEEIDGPMLILSNHQSFYDFYHICKYASPSKAILVGNRYYFRFPFFRHVLKKIKSIPKRLFFTDIQTVKEIMYHINNKQTVAIFPEGRLSADGCSYQIIDKMGKLIKKLNVPLVLVNINGAYATKPKWAKKTRRGQVSVTTKKVIYPEEIEKLSVDELNKIIDDNLMVNEYKFLLENNYTYKSKYKAEDIAELLYYCPHCHSLYTITGNKNIIECNKCHYKLEIQTNYSLKEISECKENINSIHEWNNIQKAFEKNTINNVFEFEIEVIVKKISQESPKKDIEGNGKCILNINGFSFEGIINNKALSFNLPFKELKALPYSGKQEFECYYDNELYYFYPVNNKYQVVRWAMVVDMIQERIRDGK